jgi:hypothetical protein
MIEKFTTSNAKNLQKKHVAVLALLAGKAFLGLITNPTDKSTSHFHAEQTPTRKLGFSHEWTL